MQRDVTMQSDKLANIVTIMSGALLLGISMVLGGIPAMLLSGVIFYWFRKSAAQKKSHYQALSYGDSPLLFQKAMLFAGRIGLKQTPMFYISQDQKTLFRIIQNEKGYGIVCSQALFQGFSQDEIIALISRQIAHIGNNSLLIIQAGNGLKRISKMVTPFLGFFVLIQLSFIFIVNWLFMLFLAGVLVSMPLINYIWKRTLLFAVESKGDTEAARMIQDNSVLIQAITKAYQMENPSVQTQELPEDLQRRIEAIKDSGAGVLSQWF